MGKQYSPPGWEEFLEVLTNLDGKKQMHAFFDIFLTPAEVKALGKRIQIIKELMENKLSQRETAKKLRTSIGKITRGSNALKRGSPAIRSLIKQKMKNHVC